MTYGGKDIWSESLNPPQSKIRYTAEFEWMEAAQATCGWLVFDSLESDTQALLIAYWRTKQRIIAVEREWNK